MAADQWSLENVTWRSAFEDSGGLQQVSISPTKKRSSLTKKRKKKKATGSAVGLFGSLAQIVFLLMAVSLLSTLMDHETHHSILTDIEVTHAVNVAQNAAIAGDNLTGPSYSKTQHSSRETVSVKSGNPPTSSQKATVIGFAVVITGCNKRFPTHDSAAVLKHSVHMQSVRARNEDANDDLRRYDYAMYAIYHPNATSCVRKLPELGYTLLERETPVNVSEIQGAYVRYTITSNGCCGEKELLKFEAFLLRQHPAVVLMDIDVVVLKPLDDLFDLLIHGGAESVVAHRHVMWRDRPLPRDIRLLYTIDYGMVAPEKEVKPAQGGFAIIKPNRTVYKDILAIVLKGEWGKKGWANATGKFWGAMTFQGLIPYYFFILHPGHAVELDWCLHNNMAAPPREDNNSAHQHHRPPKCLTNTRYCQDCRLIPHSEVYSFHFTHCLKPWLCIPHTRHDDNFTRTCRHFNQEWFRTRSELEKSWGRVGVGTGNFEEEMFHGYCKGRGSVSYERIERPYGKPVSKK